MKDKKKWEAPQVDDAELANVAGGGYNTKTKPMPVAAGGFWNDGGGIRGWQTKQGKNFWTKTYNSGKTRTWWS